jgi:hypothetical protein
MASARILKVTELDGHHLIAIHVDSKDLSLNRLERLGDLKSIVWWFGESARQHC